MSWRLEPSPVSIISRETSFLQLPMTSVKKVQVALIFWFDLEIGNLWSWGRSNSRSVVCFFWLFLDFWFKDVFSGMFFLSPSSWTRNLPPKKKHQQLLAPNPRREIPTQIPGGLLECPERRCQNCFNFFGVPRWWRHCAKSGYKRCDISKCSNLILVGLGSGILIYILYIYTWFEL